MSLMKIVLLDTSYPINSRNSKIIQSMLHAIPSVEIHQVTWNRDGHCQMENEPFVHLYDKLSQTGKLWRKAKNLFRYRRFVHSMIKKINPEIVIASHWDTLILVPKLERKRQKLIYENLDVPTGRFRAVFCLLERRALKRVDLIIHASRFFKELYPQSIKQIVLENKPYFTIKNTERDIVHKPLRIAYIGNIRYKYILFNLIDAVRGNEKLKLTLHGGGAEYEDVKAYSKGISNVEMTGPYEYKDISKIYTDVDVIWAVYPSKDFNVKYAISNKFFESIYLKIPCIYANNTMLGDYVCQHNIGMVVNPYDVEAIRQLFFKIINGSINLQQITNELTVFNSMQSSWNEDFSHVLALIKEWNMIQ